MTNTNRSGRTLTQQVLAELEAKHEINTRKLSILAADPTYRRVDPNMDFETYTCAPSTGDAIRAMILEVCKAFAVYPTDLGYMLHLELA